MNNTNIIKKIQTAMKQITVTDLGSSVLQPEKAARFVRVVSQSTPVLDECRLITMNAQKRDIDRTGFGSRILKDPNDTDLTSEPTFNTNQLDVEEVIAIVGIKDDALEDNIEQENFENTLLDMIADRAGIDMEELFIQGDVGSGDSFLALIDGWHKLAGNQLDGGTADFDATDIESNLDALLAAIDPKYYRNLAEWRFYVTWAMANDYRDILRQRGTGLGDTAQTTGNQLYYKGIPLVVAPNMASGNALLTHPRNTVYGIWRDLRIEPDRLPKDRQTDFVVTMRIDANYEDEDAVAASTGYTG